MADKEPKFKDLDISFKPNPYNGDLRVKKGIQAIKQAVEQLVLTNFGERPFEYDFGSNIPAYLFENFNPIIRNSLASRVNELIRFYEPRVLAESIEVVCRDDYNELNVEIKYAVKNGPYSYATLKFKTIR